MVVRAVGKSYNWCVPGRRVTSGTPTTRATLLTANNLFISAGVCTEDTIWKWIICLWEPLMLFLLTVLLCYLDVKNQSIV